MGIHTTTFCSSAFSSLVLLRLALAQEHYHGAAQSNTTTSAGLGQQGHQGHGTPTANDVKIFNMASYSSHPEHAATIYAHIGLMILAWAALLPLGMLWLSKALAELANSLNPAVMFSIARSRLTVLSQIGFLILNGIGVFLGFVYNHETPDLYRNNAHHKLGWAVTWIAVAWALVGMVKFYSKRNETVCSNPYRPVTTEAIDEHQRLHEPHSPGASRWSDDSDGDTDRHAATLCQSSRSNSWSPEDNILPSQKHHRYTDSESDLEESEKPGVLGNNAVDRFFSRHSPRIASGRSLKLLTVMYVVVERLLLPLGFAATATAAVTYGGIARQNHVFNVLAHLIKGGIFFWYGLLTFGRWMGCFSDFGWAWNLKPGKEIVGSRRSRLPSAEFTESFVIFLYGASNVFLEHLAAWGKAWTAMDLEHVSITILFFGGGMVSFEALPLESQ